MEAMESALDMIDLMICPAFCVKENKIIRVNEAAKRLFLEPRMDLLPLLASGKEEYADFHRGCLYLTLTLAGQDQGAAVTRVGDVDIFLADEQTELRELQVLALAAQELRSPLSSVILSADLLGKVQQTREGRDSAARLNRGAARLQRLVCNMSDALRYSAGGHLQLRNITAILSEIFEKARELAASAGVSLSYQGLREDVYTLTDAEQLERAVYNMVSNALKFTPKGGSVEARLQKSGRQLRLTLSDTGSGIADGILQSIFTRYLRQPSLEDSRFGLGLGMVLIRCAARTHGGTVLIDRQNPGTRISLTLAIRENPGNMLRSPMLSVDYAGERDHSLLELSDSLPPELYLPPESE